MYYESHGGGCCGISHIVSFSNEDEERLRRIIQDALSEVSEEDAAPDPWDYDDLEDDPEYKADLKAWREQKKKSTFNHLIEVVLTDEQMRTWATTLKRVGFTLGPRFLNSNSGNWCTVLFYQTAKRRGKDVAPRPYKW